MKVLVAGGAGYIGAHVVRALAQHGHTPIILDDLRSSSEDRATGYLLEKVALEEVDSVFRVLKHHRPEAIVHLGGTSVLANPSRFPRSTGKITLEPGSALF